ncbi:MAG: hypothetical protein AB1454_12495 [Candidatus Auribacterota bacterium]
MELNTILSTHIDTINDFCNDVVWKYGYIDEEDDEFYFDFSQIELQTIADEFISFFELKYPLSLDQLISICSNSNYFVQPLLENHKPRGYHFEYRDRVHIFFKENDTPCGKITTILHELFEIINDNLAKQSITGKKNSNIEEDADKFSVYVQVPNSYVFDFINSAGLDVFGLKDHMQCSYATALIRMNEVLCYSERSDESTHISMISILYERKFWENNSCNKIPRLSLGIFCKSKGFPFGMSRSEVRDLRFNEKFSIRKLIQDNKKYRTNVFLPTLLMTLKNTSLFVNVLIRPVIWKGSNYASKVLVQIAPALGNELKLLAKKINAITINQG